MSRHFDDFDAVLEFGALDDFGQMIFALQSSPRFRSGIDLFEHHETWRSCPTGLPLSARFDGHRREHALDRV